MKKNDRVQVTIEDMKFSNLGIAHLEGKEIKIKNALIGHTVEIGLSKIKAKKAKGKVKEVIKRADYEIEAPCIHYDVCGGCSRQTMPITDQGELKEKLVKDLFNETILK